MFSSDHFGATLCLTADICLQSGCRRLSHLFGVIVHHTGGVVHCQTDLVLSLAGLGPPQPDLVFAELTGNVRDDFPHVQTLPCAVVTSAEHHIQMSLQASIHKYF